MTGASGCSLPSAGSSAASGGKPVLELAGDTSPGVHDMLFPPCDRWLYESRSLAGHPNCPDNFLAAAASARIVLPAVSNPVNLFRNSGRDLMARWLSAWPTQWQTCQQPEFAESYVGHSR